MRRPYPHRPAALGLALLACLLAPACTDADLYSPLTPPLTADRVALTGRVCTEDPALARFPVRVVLLVDRAAGPLFADFDAQGQRVGVLQSFVQSALASPETSLAVVSYSGRSQRLAPLTGNFTRNPGQLLASITQLSLPEACLGTDQCRDWQDGLRTARAVIEGDMAAQPAGTRILTQYVILHVNAGPHSPMALQRDCCAPGDVECLAQGDTPSPACQAQRDAALVADLSEAVSAGGAAGLRYHTFHMAAAADPQVNDQVGASMREMAFAGGGGYVRIAGIGGFSPTLLDVLDIRTELRAKLLMVSNRNASPSPVGPVPDSDGDGLSDAEEALSGTDPTLADTDGDGLGDLVEVLVGFDPFEVTVPKACSEVVAAADTDADGLSDCDEVLLGTDISLVDTDGDGLPDREEVIGGTDYLGADAEADDDGDGVVNGDEIRNHTDPRSTDAASALGFAYRYEIDDEGVVRELLWEPLVRIPGVELVSLSGGTTAGLGVLSWSPATKTLSWRDAGDGLLGTPVPVGEGGELQLPSSSFAEIQGDEGRFVTVRVSPVDLSPLDAVETVRITQRSRQCLRYTVRNIQMMATRAVEGSDTPGDNDLVLSFAEAPVDRLGIPGPFRMALIPIRFQPPDLRVPADPVIEVFDEEFVRPRLRP